MDGYKRFADYSWPSQKRLRRHLRQDLSRDNEANAEGAAGPASPIDNLGEIEQEQRRQSLDESRSDSEHSQLISDEPESETDNENSECVPANPECEQVPSEDDQQEFHESIDESVSSVASDDDSESVYSNDEHDDERLYDREDAPQRDDDEPLYEGAPLTAAESSTALLNISLRHNMSDAVLSDVLRLVELHCPPGNKCKKTLHTLRKSFTKTETPLIRHYFCEICMRNVDRPDSVCPSCDSADNITYFIEAPIISQLKALYKRPGFQDMLQHRHTRDRENVNNYEDIYDGAVYKELCEEHGFLNDRANISFTWYTDGVHIFKSSKFNIWPVYLSINELPFAARTKKENIILASLWFGDKKPVPNLYLAPLQDSIRQLRQGIDVEIPNANEPVIVKGIIICGTCDLPAKALFLNMKQYNGKFGCQKCKQEGVQWTEGGENVRIWPYEPLLKLRSDAETIEHAQQAFDADTPVCGVKGPSIMSTIVHQSMRAISIDMMHCVAEGVVKDLMKFWFLSAEHLSSISEHIRLVDMRLKALTPPSFIQRLPRSISQHLPYWKAHERKAWLFYYSIPCVYDLLEQNYFDHYLLLVQGISLLCKSSISPNEVEVSERALREFVCRYEHLYGRRNMTNNIHQLLHLAENVRQFGPLWTTSCFPFEDLNGRLILMVHGSNSAQLQIYKAVSMFLRLTTFKAEKLVEGRPAYDFCEELNSKRGRIKRHRVSDSIYIVGKGTKLHQISPELQQLLEEANVQVATCFTYKRLLQRNVMYSCTEYKRSKRTNSAFAVYSVEGNSSRIGQIRYFIRISDCHCPSLCDCMARNYAVLTPCVVREQFATCINGKTLSNIHTVVRYENDKQVVDVSRLKNVCLYCHVQGSAASYIIEPVNRLEWE